MVSSCKDSPLGGVPTRAASASNTLGAPPYLPVRNISVLLKVLIIGANPCGTGTIPCLTQQEHRSSFHRFGAVRWGNSCRSRCTLLDDDSLCQVCRRCFCERMMRGWIVCTYKVTTIAVITLWNCCSASSEERCFIERDQGKLSDCLRCGVEMGQRGRLKWCSRRRW